MRSWEGRREDRKTVASRPSNPRSDCGFRMRIRKIGRSHPLFERALAEREGARRGAAVATQTARQRRWMNRTEVGEWRGRVVAGGGSIDGAERDAREDGGVAAEGGSERKGTRSSWDDGQCESFPRLFQWPARRNDGT